MGILALLTYLYEIPAGACLGYLILQTFCLILQMSIRNPVFTRSLLGICNREKCHVTRARIFDRGKHANRRYFSYSNSWFASLSLFLADAAGSGCGAVSNSGHRRPGKQAPPVGGRGFHPRPRVLCGGFTRYPRLWKRHE